MNLCSPENRSELMRSENTVHGARERRYEHPQLRDIEKLRKPSREAKQAFHSLAGTACCGNLSDNSSLLNMAAVV